MRQSRPSRALPYVVRRVMDSTLRFVRGLYVCNICDELVGNYPFDFRIMHKIVTALPLQCNVVACLRVCVCECRGLVAALYLFSCNRDDLLPK